MYALTAILPAVWDNGVKVSYRAIMTKPSQPGFGNFSPKDFLRARRPEAFSDSWSEDENRLDRSLLEYHLDTITSRSQEVRFEEFARALVEKEVCPNLVPQTGPTGGGDSKADTETYPVADSLSFNWFVGIGREATNERWAFAASAKKTWGQKVRADVASIVETGRGYAKIFFISSRYIRSKDRAAAEDELTKKYGSEVRIFDRTWILDKVFENKREDLAIEKLDLAITKVPTINKGSLDLQRERDLEEIEARIEQAVTAEQYSLHLAHDVLTAAILSRALERPRIETDGRFERADRIVQKCGIPHQYVRNSYDRAQTAFWWYEDFPEFLMRYDAMEERVRDSWNTYDFELLTNLWILLHGLFQRQDTVIPKSSYEEKSLRLSAELDRIASQEDRPSSVAQAKTMKILISIFRAGPSSKDLESLLDELAVLITEAEGLAGYPMLQLVNLLVELEDMLDEIPGYRRLFNQIVDIAGTRKNDVVAATMLVKSGQKQLLRDRPKQGIVNLGTALGRLYKRESRRELVRALYLCGRAYERLGLFWAARGSLLIAASLSTDDLFAKGELNLIQLLCFNRIKWVELQLGRVPHLLMWHQIDQVLARALTERDIDTSRIEQSELQFDFSLAILLLKTDFWELKWLKGLPDTLEAHDLLAASETVLFALGDAEHRWRPPDGESLEAVLIQSRSSGIFKELPARPLFYEQRTVDLQSNVLGCVISISCDNRHPSIELGESMLAALEAIFATSSWTEAIAKEPSCTFEIRHKDFASFPFEYTMSTQDGHPHFAISCAEFSPNRLTPEQMSAIKGKMLECLSYVLAHILWINGSFEAYMKQLFGDELALQRALDFTGSFVALGNLIGNSPKERISQWADPAVKQYQLRRSDPWDCGLPDTNAEEEKTTHVDPESAEHSKGDVKHSQIEMISPIRTELWDKAGWNATAFAVSPDPGVPPIMAPVFQDRASALEIFAAWRREIGTEDSDEVIRVSLVRGISKAEPFSYSVAIGANSEAKPLRKETKYFILMSRLNRMTPASSFNLDRFEKSVALCGRYYLAPAVYTGRDSEYELLHDNHLLKSHVHFREAWSIGPGDPDGVAVREDDDPIVPPDVRDEPPYKRLLKWKKGGFGPT